MYNSQEYYIEKIPQLKARLRREKPVIHHITNFVTMYQCARITAFLGAAPIMAFAASETGQVTARADALVVNTGTLNDEVIRSIPLSMEFANDDGTPVILDPVGAKLSDYRFSFVHRLLRDHHFDVIRCNGVELLNLYGQSLQAKGIDGDSDSPQIPEAALAVARKYNTCVACTGLHDYVSDGEDVITLNRGVAQLPQLVGTGCMVNSLIGSYLPVADSPAEAAICGILTMCLAGEAAARRLEHPEQLGSFETYLMDAISQS